MRRGATLARCSDGARSRSAGFCSSERSAVRRAAAWALISDRNACSHARRPSSRGWCWRARSASTLERALWWRNARTIRCGADGALFGVR
ncbi:hypothetical protein DP49_3866 [Burkholderia pseudomallei]|nr:hypothetical protein DO65_5886 [Burkholderia pseudomallei]KGD56867.1 hypothetical protein DP49_3866 [Burkholderia pseudomallei]